MDAWTRQRSAVRVLVQHGFTAPLERSALVQVEFLGHHDLKRLLSRSRAVVCHGGPGTIFDCRREGLLPVVMPRSAGQGEHVDDHQVLFTRRLAQAQLIDRVQTQEQLHKALEGALDRPRTTLESADDAAVVASTQRLSALVDEALTQKRNNRERPHEEPLA
ncbi:glycosyltransferase [Serinicoccus marinus]|uniref:glycosyltransferase n=1 Tax=Serinicoccus marinus TaxID=247333 RepID=UPI002490C433|nr:glycosyltransferase [Serinicoccus marinus]